MKLNNKISFNTNLSFNYSILESNDGSNLKNSGFYYNGMLNMKLNIWKNGAISGYFGVYSPRIMLQGKSGKFSYSSLTVSQELFKKKLTASFTIPDPFRYKYKYEYSLEDPAFHQSSITYYYDRYIKLNLSYRFGQMKDAIKKAKRGIKNDDVKGSDSSPVS